MGSLWIQVRVRLSRMPLPSSTVRWARVPANQPVNVPDRPVPLNVYFVVPPHGQVMAVVSWLAPVPYANVHVPVGTSCPDIVRCVTTRVVVESVLARRTASA